SSPESGLGRGRGFRRGNRRGRRRRGWRRGRRGFLWRGNRARVRLTDHLAAHHGPFVDEKAAALVDHVALDQSVDLEVSAGRFRGFRDQAMEDRLPGSLREEVPGYHAGDVADTVVSHEQVAAN